MCRIFFTGYGGKGAKTSWAHNPKYSLYDVTDSRLRFLSESSCKPVVDGASATCFDLPAASDRVIQCVCKLRRLKQVCDPRQQLYTGHLGSNLFQLAGAQRRDDKTFHKHTRCRFHSKSFTTRPSSLRMRPPKPCRSATDSSSRALLATAHEPP